MVDEEIASLGSGYRTSWEHQKILKEDILKRRNKVENKLNLIMRKIIIYNFMSYVCLLVLVLFALNSI